MNVHHVALSPFGGCSAILETDSGESIRCKVTPGAHSGKYSARAIDTDERLSNGAEELLLRAHHEAQLHELDRINARLPR